MLGIIRVLTTHDNQVLQEHGKKMKDKFGIETETKSISDQPNGIYNDESEQKAIPKIIALAKDMSQDKKINAITISCAADPALQEIRKSVEMPVFGAGECGAYAASMVGSHVGVIGIKETPPPAVKNALGEKFHSYSFSPNLRKTTDLFSNHAKKQLLDIVKQLIESGADVILFACTGFSTIRLKRYLVEHIDIPIIDLVDAQAMAFNLLDE